MNQIMASMRDRWGDSLLTALTGLLVVMLFVVAPMSIVGCVVLFISLPIEAKLLFPIWSAIGLALYFSYGFWRSNVRRGVIDVEDLDGSAPGGPF